MKKWTSTFCLSLMTTSILTLLSGSAEANIWNPRCWSLCGLSFEAQIEAITWKPCVDDLDYAAEVTTGSSGTSVGYKEICPEWETGVRAAIRFPSFCQNWTVQTSYTYFHGNTFEDISFSGTPSGSIGITSSLIHPELLPATLFSDAEGRYKFTYQEWDLLMKYDLCCDGAQELNPFFGLVGVHLSQRLNATFDDEGTVRWKGCYTGIGLRAGSVYSYSIEDCLRVFASAHGSLVIGKAHSKNQQDFTSSLTLKDDDCCHSMAGYHIAIGVNYEGCLCSYPYTLTAGYEFLNWYHAPNHRVFTSDGEIAEISHSTSPSTRTLGFHGVFAGLVLPF